MVFWYHFLLRIELFCEIWHVLCDLLFLYVKLLGLSSYLERMVSNSHLSMIKLLSELINLTLAISCKPKPLNLGIIDGFHNSVKNDIFALSLFKNSLDKLKPLDEIIEHKLNLIHLHPILLRIIYHGIDNILKLLPHFGFKSKIV